MSKKAKIIIVAVLVVSICATIGVIYANNAKTAQEKFKNLTEEDKQVKEEIAQYCDTEVDFRNNMQEDILGDKHDVQFVEINEHNTEKVIYQNDLGDEFEYNIETGKLCEAVIDSNIVNKTDNSIDIDEAHKIAMKLLPKEVDIKEYTQYAYRENSKGYFFWYQRYIGKYRTTDSFSVTIGYDGSVVELNDSTHMFSDKKFNFDETYITKKIDEYFKDYENADIDYDHTTIMIYEGKICANVDVTIKNENYTDSSVEIVPLE